MGQGRVAISIALLTLQLCMLGCGWGGRNAVQLSTEPAGPVPALLPPPSALHGASYTQEDLSHWGSEYGRGLPCRNMYYDGNEGVFTPHCFMPSDSFNLLAYATYEFQLADFDLNPSLRLSWAQRGEISDGWVAFADFASDRWEWSQLPNSGVMLFDPSKNISDSGVVYVVLLFSGTAWWRLEQIQIAAEWPMFGHDSQHTRRSPFTGPITNALKWSYHTLGSISSSPAIAADGTVYVGSIDGIFYAINPDISLKWAYATGWGLPQSSPAIAADGTVYVGSWDHKLYAINSDGSLKWDYTTGGDVESSPAIGTDGTLYIGSRDSKLYAINPDGSLKWFYTTGTEVASSPAIGADGTVYVGSWDSNLYAINPDGSLKWLYTTGAGIYSSPAIGADWTVYVGSMDNKLYAINPDGSLKWTYATGDIVFSSPAIGTDGTLYVGSNDNKLHAINPDGSMKWTYTTGDDVEFSPAIGADGTVYVGSYDCKLYAIGPGGG